MNGNAHDAAGEETRVANAILACLENEGPMSRAMVAKKLNLSRTTLSTLISRFIDLKLVKETEGDDPQGRGRPGIPVDLDVSTWFALGAEFRSGCWQFVLADLKGKAVLTKTQRPSGTSPESCLAALVKGVAAVRKKVPGHLLPAVGIGAPGLVDWESGTILRADDLGWVNVKVRERVEREIGLSAYVLNRNRVTGLAEARFGQGRNTDNFIYIGVGTGISAAIMLKGVLLHGHAYGAGEIGHMVIDPDGPPCRCGKKGCLQTLAAGEALTAMVCHKTGSAKTRSQHSATPPNKKNAMADEITGEEVCRMAMRGNPTAQAAIRFAASALAVAIGNLVTTLNPEKFIIGGPLVNASPVLVDYLREETDKYQAGHLSTSIVASTLGEQAGALGAACLALRQKLELCSQFTAAEEV